MTMKSALKNLMERVTGFHIYRTLPRGIDVHQDLKEYLPRLRVETVFDVGANVGQSARRFLKWFPTSTVFCFEPVRATFLKLQAELGGEQRVHLYQLALGAGQGDAVMVRTRIAEMAHLCKPEEGAVHGTETEKVTMTTLDAFCLCGSVARIDYLKIDAEGADLEILRGGEGLLDAHRIAVVEVEAGMTSRNDTHIPFGAFTQLLEQKRYFLFGVYEQVGEWIAGEPQLRRSNAVFISETLLEANRVK